MTKEEELSLNGKDFWKWAGRIEEKVDTNSATLGELKVELKTVSKDHKEDFKEMSNYYQNHEVRIKGVEEKKNNPKPDNQFISWKWVVEKLWQPALMAIVTFIIVYVMTQVLK